MPSITFLACKNTYISNWYPDHNFSSSQALFVSQYQQTGDGYRSLLQFDLSSIPPGCTIEKADLLLSLYRNEVQSGIVNVSVHRLLNRWMEYASSWMNQPPLSASLDGSIAFESNSIPGIHSIDVSNLVRGWYDGSIANNGLLLVGCEEQNNLLAFRSSRYQNSDAWPQLAVKFIDGVLEIADKQELIIPAPPATSIIESGPIALGPRKIATFMILNTSSSNRVKVKIQLSFENHADAIFFDAGPWHSLQPQGYPGEALALSASEAAEYARVLCWGAGGEKLLIYPRSK